MGGECLLQTFVKYTHSMVPSLMPNTRTSPHFISPVSFPRYISFLLSSKDFRGPKDNHCPTRQNCNHNLLSKEERKERSVHRVSSNKYYSYSNRHGISYSYSYSSLLSSIILCVTYVFFLPLWDIHGCFPAVDLGWCVGI